MQGAIGRASLGLVTLLLAGFIVAMTIGLTREALYVWHTR